MFPHGNGMGSDLKTNGLTCLQITAGSSQTQKPGSMVGYESPPTALDGESLISAIRKGDTKLAISSLERGADPNTKTESGVTALMLSATFNNLEVARMLLLRGADMTAVDRFGHDAFACASRADNQEVLVLLRTYSGKDTHRERLDGLARRIHELGGDWINANMIKDVEGFVAEVVSFLPLLPESAVGSIIGLVFKKPNSKFSSLLAEQFPITSMSHLPVLLKLVSMVSASTAKSKFVEIFGRNMDVNSKRCLQKLGERYWSCLCLIKTPGLLEA